MLHVRGMNGEPITSCPTPINLNYKWIDNPYYFNLETDDNGNINLGQLNYVERVVTGNH